MMRYLFLLLTLVSCSCISTTWACKHKKNKMTHTFKIELMKGFPNTEEGIEKGVSAPFAGVIRNQLIVAGGCNFPDKPVAEGGKKRFYKGIYRAELSESTSLKWIKIGEMPEEAAYGVSVTYKDTMYFVGGCNLNGSLTWVYSLTLEGEELIPRIKKCPLLPCTMDNMAGTVVNGQLIVAGGLQDNLPSFSVYALDLDTPTNGWILLGGIPKTPRVQPVCASINNRLAVFGGFFSGDKRQKPMVFTDGLSFNREKREWKDLGFIGENEAESITTTGAAMVNISPNEVVLAGGVNKDLFFDAISGAYNMVKKEDYLLQPVEWYRFNTNLMHYSGETNKWTKTNLSSPHLARAGAAMVVHGNHIYYIGGELKPGIRSAQISRIIF